MLTPSSPEVKTLLLSTVAVINAVSIVSSLVVLPIAISASQLLDGSSQYYISIGYHDKSLVESNSTLTAVAAGL